MNVFFKGTFRGWSAMRRQGQTICRMHVADFPANSLFWTGSFARGAPSISAANTGCNLAKGGIQKRRIFVAMRKPTTVRSTEAFTRTRLSESFFMRDFLYSEIASIHGMNNLPEDPDVAIAAGQGLCQNLLEPLQRTFGRLAIRSAYRSPQVNAFGNTHFQNCASNERNRARHIWDQRSDDGGMGAMTTIVVPWLVDRITKGLTWQAMAWWIHDHLPYSELQFFSKLVAFNIGWHEIPKRRISSFIRPRGLLTKPGMPGHDENHSDQYPGFPKLVPAV